MMARMPGLKHSASGDVASSDASKRPQKLGQKRPRRETDREQAPEHLSSSSFIITTSSSEVNFPRGGGTSLTPFEHKQALREVNEESRRKKPRSVSSQRQDPSARDGLDTSEDLFATSEQKTRDKQRLNRERKNAQRKKRSLDSSAAPTKRSGTATDTLNNVEDALPRIEVLNYKRLSIGTRLLCTVLAVHPLALVLSLPDQLLGHVPITSISELYTQRLERSADDEKSDNETKSDFDGDESDSASSSQSFTHSKQPHAAYTQVSELRDLFEVGQWVQASVTALHAPGSHKPSRGREGGEYEQESKRVELSLDPNLVNEGVSVADLSKGFVMPMTVKSKEDNGYLMNVGIEEARDLEGFVAFKDMQPGKVLHEGQVVQASVVHVSENRRSLSATLDGRTLATSTVQQTPSATALLPGTLVNALVMSTSSEGLNVKLFGMFDATIASAHLQPSQTYNIGQRVNARILWEEGQTLRMDEDVRASLKRHKIALATTPAIVRLQPRTALATAYPIGMFVKATVLNAIEDWGVLSRIEGQDDVRAFTHISNCSDAHTTSLPATSGPFRIGTTHAGRIIGHALTDDVVRLSFERSVLQRAFMRVSEVNAGQVIKGSIRSITPRAILLNINGSVDGVVFPAHFADVPLKRPEKKYKVGQSVVGRVLKVDPEQNRISMTLKRTLLQSTLPAVCTMQDCRVGVVTHGVITRIIEGNVAPTGILVDLYGHVRVYVPVVEMTESGGTNAGAAAIPSPEVLRQSFFVGKCVKVRITRVEQESGRVMASIRQTSESFLKRLNVDAVTIGDRVTGKLAAVHQDVVVLELQPSTVRALLGLGTLAKERNTTIDELRAALTEGELITNLRVLDRKADRGIVIVGTSGSSLHQGSVVGFEAGSYVSARVAKRDGSNAVSLHVGTALRCRLHAVDCSDDYSGKDAEALLPSHEGSILRVCLLNVKGTTNKRADVSIRQSRMQSLQDQQANSGVKDAEINSVSNLNVGQRVRGFVKSKAEKAGLFVDIGRSVTARVKIAEMFDTFVADWASNFRLGQLVSGTVTEVNNSQNKVELSLRTLPGSAKDKQTSNKHETDTAKFEILEEGEKVKASVRAIADFGVFVQIEGSKVSGLAHKSQLSDDVEAEKALRAFNVGDKVKAVILKIDKTTKKISFGLKPSLFDEHDVVDSESEKDSTSGGEAFGDSDEEGDGDAEMDTSSALLEDDDPSDDDLLQTDNDESKNGNMKEKDDDVYSSGPGDHSVDDESDDELLETLQENMPSRNATKVTKARDEAVVVAPVLQLGKGLSWSARAGDGEESEADSDDASRDSEGAEENSGRKKRRSKKKTQEDLTADLANKMPESAQEFERLLLSSPNSSFLWIQFISFQVHLGDVDKARQLAQRALQVIHFREEGEKLNIWLALLNLENSYGSEESLESTFKEACTYNDGKVMHLRFVDILEQSGKVQAAQEHWKKTAKKFGLSAKVWIGYHRFLLRQGGSVSSGDDDARSVVARSMQSLEKRKHVKTIVAYALDEFKSIGGDAERGRTIFEGLIDTYPKRLDIWWQYVDQEQKLGNVAHVRDLFRRILDTKQSSKKFKSILKKWLEFEKGHGDSASQQAVLERARTFVEERRRAVASTFDDQDDDEEVDDNDSDNEMHEEQQQQPQKE